MSKFESKKVMPRYLAIAVLLTLVGIAIVAKAAYVMTAQKDYWKVVEKGQKADSIYNKPRRGNILSCDGQLMASSIPEYKIYVDFQPYKIRGQEPDTAKVHKLDTLWMQNIDSICIGLHRIFPERSAAEFKKRLEEGRHKVQRDGTLGARHWPVWPKRIDYNTYLEVKSLPIFSLKTGKGGFHHELTNARQRPFGSLASRTLGNLYAMKDEARNGLELAYDSVLRGETGVVEYRKVLDRNLKFTLKPTVDGADIVTTIDVGLQDLCERAVLEEMKLPDVNADMGVAILMEVATGDVKAIVNMERSLTETPEGNRVTYSEQVNRAVSYRCEPGSVFKVASFLVALDDGVVDTSYVIHTGCGIYPFHNRNMKDHNWRRGGYGDINVARSLEVSSNVGVSYVINRFYGNNPAKYVQGLYRIGIADDLEVPIPGYKKPWIRMPNTKTTNRQEYWSSTTLPWMSIGYETQIAPINTVTFYNAIANNGRMMKPRFVKAVQKDGQVIEEFPPVVLREHIAKPQTIETMQTILEHVVSQGLGRKAGSRAFKVAGKTGTAQIADEKGGYHSGVTRYWLSFAGYFPADKPKYSCIVCLRKTGMPASGGGMSGVVFHNIAEGVMSQNVRRSVEDVRDSTSIMTPDVLDGNILAAETVLDGLNIRTSGNLGEAATAKTTNALTLESGTAPWGKAARQQDGVSLTRQKVDPDVMPDVSNMGARDALFLLESMGLKVRLNGVGRVHGQSIPKGQAIVPGAVCTLQLN